MMTYTEEEIKEWFEVMMAKYPNSNTFRHLESVKFMMFDETWGDRDLLKNVHEEAERLRIKKS